MEISERVICPQCKKDGLKSFVYPGPMMSTCMYCPPFYDEEGRLHSHDMNKTTASYSCSNGHHWEEEIKKSCWCGWPDSQKVKS